MTSLSSLKDSLVCSCIFIQFLTFFTCLIGFLLYTYWLGITGKASWLYKYIMFLFIGEMVMDSINIFFYFYNQDHILDEIQLFCFYNRMDLRCICFLLIVGHSLFKFFNRNKPVKEGLNENL